MKELLKKYAESKKEFERTTKEVEDKFGEFLESIPGWRDILGSIIVSNGYNIPDDLKDYNSIGEALIPVVRDLNFSEENLQRVSFKIRIPSDTWLYRYIEIGWFPLSWLTSPDTTPLDPEYLMQKLARRKESLREYEEEETCLHEKMGRTKREIDRIEELLKEKGY